jgi:hypothetical protein
VHWLITLAITLGILGGVGIGAIAWRLSQGPMDLDWFTGRLEAAVNSEGSPTRLTIGSAALAWEGFRMGVDRPLDLRLTDVTVTDQTGQRRISIPRAEVSLSIYELLFLRLVPRTVTLDSPRLGFVRSPDGMISLDLGAVAESADNGEPSTEPSSSTGATPLAGLLAELAKPPKNDRTHGLDPLLGQLRAVRVHDATVNVIDRQLGVIWRAPHAGIDLIRHPQGGVDGTADLALVVGEQQARVTMSANLQPGGKETQIRVRLSPVIPSVIARAAPSLAALAALDAPVGGEATLDLDGTLSLHHARISLRSGAGQAHIGAGEIPFLNAALVASGTPHAVTLETFQVNLRGHEGGPSTRVEARGTVQRDARQISASVSADVDQVDFADLPRLWPEGTDRGARHWLINNIPVGMARNGHVDLGLVAASDLSTIELTRATGRLDGDGLQVHWLRPVPPIDNGQAQLRIVDPDTLDIIVTGGRQRLRNQREGSAAGLQIRSGSMRITGLMRSHQLGVIEADVSGTLADSLTLLREPRLQLLDRHPIELSNPSGQVAVKLRLSVPLEDNVTMDAIPVQVQARLDAVHLGRLVAGRDLDQGTLDLTANNDGMKVNGRALLAAIPAKLDAAMDFRAGPPTQVVQSATISGQADARQLAAAGLDATPLLSGPTQLQAVLTERRNGQGDVTVDADLTAAELTVRALEWRKPRDAAAKASARLMLNRDQLIAIDAVQMDGDGLVLRGRAEAIGGSVASLRVDQLVLGRTVAQATINLPASGPIKGTVTGQTLDLGPRLGRKTPPQVAQGPKPEPPPGPPWAVDAKFDRVLLAAGATASNVALHAEDDGRVLQQLNLDGRTGHGAFLVRIVPNGGGRRLTASADDAGELLRGLDYLRSMQGGKLSVQAEYDDAQPGRPLAGTANIENFRVRDAPALGRLLQAMTLYGLVELVQGPGLGFTRLVAPFRLTDDALDLTDARAFSSSLGLTAKGRANLDAQRLDMQGTIVPAYFFNSLLGNVPLVGRLFSPERGGGVFAASYTVRGPIEDPQVSVNPLSALTPGFLRGLFGIF